MPLALENHKGQRWFPKAYIHLYSKKAKVSDTGPKNPIVTRYSDQLPTVTNKLF